MLQIITIPEKYKYLLPISDEALLRSVKPSLVTLKERLLRKVEGFNPIYSQVSLNVPTKKKNILTERHTKLEAESLAEHFMIGPQKARATLGATTQNCTRSSILPISRRYRIDYFFKLKRLKGKFTSDTLWV